MTAGHLRQRFEVHQLVGTPMGLETQDLPYGWGDTRAARCTMSCRLYEYRRGSVSGTFADQYPCKSLCMISKSEHDDH